MENNQYKKTSTIVIIRELEANRNVINPEVDREPEGWGDGEITFIHSGKTLPMGLVKFLGGFGDLRVEGIREEDNQLELSLYY